MKSFIITGAALVATSAVFVEAADSPAALTDADILNFALTLEHLEANFYSQGLQKYDASAFTSAGFSASVRPSIQKVSNDETAHVSFLTSALQAAGATPVQACNYTFPHKDVKSFLAVSQILEGVGVSAYLGAAASIQNGAYLTAAAAILTVESRHNAAVRAINGESPFPAAFDTPLTPRSIVTLASPFFASCPNGSAPGFQGFPALNITGNLTAGATLTVASANATGATNCGFLSGLNSTFSSYADGKCQVPTDGKIGGGQIYVFLTSAQNVTDATTIAGPAIIDTDVPGSVQPVGGFFNKSTSASTKAESSSAICTQSSLISAIVGFGGIVTSLLL